MTTYDFDDKAYDALIADADRDRAVGKHDFMVTSVSLGAWPDGRERFDIDGVLLSNGNMKFKFSLNPPDSPEAIEAEASGGRKRGMLLNIKSWKAIKALGFKSPLDMKDGTEFQVDIYREKPKEGRDIGFLRLSHIVGPAKGTASADKNMPGF